MTDANNMVHITQRKFQQLIREDTRRVGKPEKTMIRKAGSQPHGPRVQNSLMAKAAQRSVAVDNFDLLADQDVAEYWEEREDCWQC